MNFLDNKIIKLVQKDFLVSKEKVKNNTIIVWKFIQSINGSYGFIEIEDYEEHIFVFGKNKKDALDQDIVKAKIKIFKWRFEAEILEVVRRADRLLMWEFQKPKNLKCGFVIPFNPAIKSDIFIPERFIGNAKPGQIVAVRVLRWEGKNPEWKIVEILWDKSNPETIINGYILEYGFKLNFPKNVLKEVKKIKYDVEEQLPKRNDLRKLFTFTIDGEDARDLDDAISIEKTETWYKLYVHIADVAHYVKAWSQVQNEAYLRATSVYLPHKVLPMLPEKLSNDLCSLNPHTDKLTLTCEMDLNEEWKVQKVNVYESVINSDYRLTYKEVQQMYDKELKEGDVLMFGGKITKQLLEKIFTAYELKNKVSAYKEEQGVLWFDFPETKIILDENLQVVDFKPYPIYESNKLIEEFMILANESVSRKFSRIPFLYRIHEKPKHEDIERLKKILDMFGVHFNFVNYDTKEFAQLIEQVKTHKEKYILEKLILRTLQKAIYSDKNVGHFGLGLDYYSHFTSPIRRYPDYQIHRLIKMKIHGKLIGKMLSLYRWKLEWIAKHCSEQEIKAQKLEWKVRDYFMVQYYKDKIWQEFEGMISGMIQTWIFVALENTAEGFVQLIDDEKDLSVWEPDLEILQFKNNQTGETLTVGQKVMVKLKSVDEDMLRLNFELV